MATQPLEDSGDRRLLAASLDAYEGMEDLLCFSSDYPHISADEPGYIARTLPDGWAPKVFERNAAELFGWDLTQPSEVVAATVGA